MPDTNGVKVKTSGSRKNLFIVIRPDCEPCPSYAEMVSKSAPKEVKQDIIVLGENQTVDTLIGIIGIQSTPAAIYVEDEKINKVIIPTGNAARDSEAIADIQKSSSADRAAGWCPIQFGIGQAGWEALVPGSDPCIAQMKKANGLGKGSRRLLGQHLSSTDSTISKLIDELKKEREQPCTDRKAHRNC